MHVFLKQYYELFVLVAALLGTLPSAYGGKAQHKTICQLCGMDAAKSQTEFILYLEHEAPMHACCLNCARRIMKRLGAEVTRMTALDYRTRKHVDATEAFYLKGSKVIPKGSMAPFLLTFGSREDAEKFKEKYNGTILTFQEVVDGLNSGKLRH